MHYSEPVARHGPRNNASQIKKIARGKNRLFSKICTYLLTIFNELVFEFSQASLLIKNNTITFKLLMCRTLCINRALRSSFRQCCKQFQWKSEQVQQIFRNHVRSSRYTLTEILLLRRPRLWSTCAKQYDALLLVTNNRYILSVWDERFRSR